MPIKRCKRCHCLSEESSYKYFIRIKTGFDTPYFCRKCFKKQDMPYIPPVKKEKIILEPLDELELLKKKKRLTPNQKKRMFSLTKNKLIGMYEHI